ncbi:hypothetical protein K503DRAFT_307854 [Rhizopogon vinicolor AM-OR11-026]|uniref:Uncharacterized protein n=1 Tax=Rhizopogon vinicolor AM-OR11-026 TaxID=1314800 RepID=A0A1B7ND46_9AGAM|nr:hypothetical protein K503DRAFT_307854 [Rhizopogon vinicolor AM-OR11-026]
MPNFRAQDIINQVSTQRSEVEADAVGARTKATKRGGQAPQIQGGFIIQTATRFRRSRPIRYNESLVKCRSA